MDVLGQDDEDIVAAAGHDSYCIIMFENIVNAVSKLEPAKHDVYCTMLDATKAFDRV